MSRLAKTMESKFDLTKFDIKKFDEILARGLSQGLGNPEGKVCIEAAICMTLGLPHGDDPGCVSSAVRSFKISLNDRLWSSPKARAIGLRDLGIAQLGSRDTVSDTKFTIRLAKKTIRTLIPTLFREIFPENKSCLDAALRCEIEGTSAAAYAAADAASVASFAAHVAAAYAAADAASVASFAAHVAAAYAAAYAAAHAVADAAAYAGAASVADSAAYAAEAVNADRSTKTGDKYLILVANLALEVLRELNSPGVALLNS
jgi:hypothetical protein